MLTPAGKLGHPVFSILKWCCSCTQITHSVIISTASSPSMALGFYLFHTASSQEKHLLASFCYLGLIILMAHKAANLPSKSKGVAVLFWTAWRRTANCISFYCQSGQGLTSRTGHRCGKHLQHFMNKAWQLLILLPVLEL